MAHKKGQGSSPTAATATPSGWASRSSAGRRCGAGRSSCEHGTRFKPGRNVALARDHSLFALVDGFVRFESHGGRGQLVSVLPAAS